MNLPTKRSGNAVEVLLAFLWLGVTSFGGPIAHLGYFRRAFVERRQWLSEDEYAEVMALCQFLPGPASSQTGFLIGFRRAGWWGAIAAWCGFTLPAALLMFGFAILAPKLTGPIALSGIHGLKLVAVAVVAQAVWSMAKKLCADRRRAAIALGAFAIILLVASPFTQLAGILGGALFGLLLCRESAAPASGVTHPPIRKRIGVLAGILFLVLLIGLPVMAHLQPGHSPWVLANIFYRSGTLVFGGGHVVLPLLRDALVPTGWIGDERFLTGYGATQAMPGPLFTFAAFLGATVSPNWGAGPTAFLAIAMIFLPGMLLVLMVYPFWAGLRQNHLAQAALAGINASVVGILGAALYNPVWTSAIVRPSDVVIAVAAFLFIEKWQAPPLVVVALCVSASIAQSVFSV